MPLSIIQSLIYSVIEEERLVVKIHGEEQQILYIDWVSKLVLNGLGYPFGIYNQHITESKNNISLK